ncbi:MAG: hypothetical protein XD78_0781 [Desulfotomaculum sp. 46_296]|nr:MAG: hypothetical protein XD78_0781 [Desulfotomaculum sp. 46_296]HAU31596.1 hypothetical protein [Desulfotomaculum sp.]
MIQVNVERIKDRQGETLLFREEVGLSHIDREEIPFAGPVDIEIELTSSDKTIQAEGTVKAVIQRPCDRCLSPVEVLIEAPFKEIYFSTSTTQDNLLQDEWISFKNEVIDIEPEVIKSLITALPMKTLCDQNCRGLCPSCGQNFNTGKCACSEEEIDPRLVELREIIKLKHGEKN